MTAGVLSPDLSSPHAHTQVQKMKRVSTLLILLAVVAAVAVAIDIPEDKIRAEFARFRETHKRFYSSPLEAEARYQLFRANYIEAMEINARTGVQSHGVTRFMDWSLEEKKAFLGYKRDFKARSQSRHQVMPRPDQVSAAPDTFDWRSTAVTPVRDQGRCGSCWAYSATEQVESAMLLKYKNGTVPSSWLSTQQTVDCDTYDYGCNGGDTITAYRYMMSVNGIASEKAYPYQAVDGSCKYSPWMATVKVTDWSWVIPPCNTGSGDCSKQDEAGMAAIMKEKGPASICVMVSNDWFSYTGPAPYHGTCTNNYYDLNHCVQVVGIGEDKTSGPYWIVRNSWGTSWGDQGYIYLPYGSNTCGVASEVTMVTVA